MSGDRSLPPPTPASRATESDDDVRAQAPLPPPTGLEAPPGYAEYSGTYGYRPELNPVRSMARWATILTAAAGVAGLVGAVLNSVVAVRAQEFLDGEISEDAFLDTNALAPVGQALGGVPMIAAAVFTMIWMYRIATNLRTLGRATTFAPVFAIVGWFLPPFLFVLPLLVMRELWKASDPGVAPGAEGWRAGGEWPLLYVWFVLYGVLPAILTVIGIGAIADAMFNLDDDTESIAEVAAAAGPVQLIGSGLLGFAAAVVWVLVVRQLTVRHVALTGER